MLAHCPLTQCAPNVRGTELKRVALAMGPWDLQRFTRPLLGGDADRQQQRQARQRRRRGGGPEEADRAQARVLSGAEVTACGALSKLAASVATYPSQAGAGGACVSRLHPR